MTLRSRSVATAAAAALVVTLSPVTASAAPCASRAEVREQIAALRADMRDEIKSRHARSATAEAVHEVIATFRGAEADTPGERRVLGREISAALKALRESRNAVEKKALGLEVKALRQQRQRGKLTKEARAEIRAAFAALRAAVLGKANAGAERRELASDFKALREQISC
jgi:hypothetical protein